MNVSYDHAFIISTSTRANVNGLVSIGAGGYNAVSPAGSSASYQGTHTMSSLDESGSGRASGLSSGMMISETSETGSRGYGAQHPGGGDLRDNPNLQGGNGERMPGQHERGHGHEHAQGRVVGHAPSTSLSTVAASPPHPQVGSLGVPTGGAFPGSGYQAQTSYSVQPTQPLLGAAKQVEQPQAPVLANMPMLPQEQYRYGSASVLHSASEFASHQGRSHSQLHSVIEPQEQRRTVQPDSRAPPVRNSSKRARAPKRLRPDPSVGIGPSRNNLVGSDTDSDDDEVEWIPGFDDGGATGGIGGNKNAGIVEPVGRSGQAAPSLPSGRKYVFFYFVASPFFPLKREVNADDCGPLDFLFPDFIFSSNFFDHPDSAATTMTTIFITVDRFGGIQSISSASYFPTSCLALPITGCRVQPHTENRT